MKQKITYILGMLIVLSMLAISAVSAETMQKIDPMNHVTSALANVNTCNTAYQIRPGNQINNQIPHFTCCKCIPAQCNGTDCCKGDFCSSGDTLRKHITLTPAIDYCGANCSFHGEADINVYNYDGLDNVNINLRIDKLYPRNEVFTAWLVDDLDQTQTMKIGEFRSNFMGRGVVNYQGNLDNFSIFDGIHITDSNMNLAASSTLNFQCSSGQDINMTL